jgi:hypothetical protein
MSTINTQIVIAALPEDKLDESHFSLREAPMPEPGDGEVLVKARYLSLDAANRAWMQGATYKAPVVAGEVMHGMTLSEVVESNHADFSPGDIVECSSGWQQFAVHKPKELGKITVRGSLSNQLSVFGISGLTAYFGLLKCGRPKAGETIVVSAAAGAAGNFVGQIGKIKGCRVVGIAGSDEKCAWLTDDLGFDAAINYKTTKVAKGLADHCPDGIDVYFDNVGGDILEAVLFQMNLNGRIACCGAVSQYDTGSPQPGPRGVPGLLVVKRLTMQGFIVSDYFAERDQATNEMAKWLADGKLKVVEDIIDGLENAPRSLIGLLNGENVGKRMICVS